MNVATCIQCGGPVRCAPPSESHDQTHGPDCVAAEEDLFELEREISAMPETPANWLSCARTFYRVVGGCHLCRRPSRLVGVPPLPRWMIH